jgi:Kelch motif
MKQLSGNYREIELVKSDSEKTVGQAPRSPSEHLAGGAPALQPRDSTHGFQLNSREWDDTVRKLVAMFNGRSVATGASPAKSALLSQINTGVVSPLQEDETHYHATAVIDKTEDRLKLAIVSWPKDPLESWLSRLENQLPSILAAMNTTYTLPKISDGTGCVDDSWTPTVGPPDARYAHTAVWTGNEMIIWGGVNGVAFNTGYKYDPATDSFTAISTVGAPSGRGYHTAVWTGIQMIVWGGEGNGPWTLNTGGRYNPVADSWVPTNMYNVPTARHSHTAVWTGSEMIVWGGMTSGSPSTYWNTGGTYNPSTDMWSAITTTNAPDYRQSYTTVWTGTEMIIMGWLVSQHWCEIQSEHRQLDGNQHGQRAYWPIQSHCSLDRWRDDHLGRIR